MTIRHHVVARGRRTKNTTCKRYNQTFIDCRCPLKSYQPSVHRMGKQAWCYYLNANPTPENLDVILQSQGRLASQHEVDKHLQSGLQETLENKKSEDNVGKD
jgi:hypothetical protein